MVDTLNDPMLPAYGWSWAKFPAPGKDDAKDPRFRTCPRCLRVGDKPDVKIVRVSSNYDDQPRCSRCGGHLNRPTRPGGPYA